MILDYDQLADQYKIYRKPDPRIAARINLHLQGVQSLLNVGAGTGSYEPENCQVVAVEPSYDMIARRLSKEAILIQGYAEHLPFKNNIFDASMGILTMHHWSDVAAGLREMLRVTKKNIVLLTWIGYNNNFWLTDYIPEIIGVDEKLFPSLDELEQIFGEISVETVEIPCDCTDGFMCAYWRRPEMYLNPDARRAISTFSRIHDLRNGLYSLRIDIEKGLWRKKYGYLFDKESLDLGYRLVVYNK